MQNYEKYYNQLNDEQKKAVDALDGPVLVLAGPGTGKTQILSIRAANIIRQKKANPENILILTFTNTASKTMKERLGAIIGLKGYDVRTATFHSFANSIILESEEAVNYVADRIELTDIEKVKAIEYILDHSKGVAEIRPFNAPYSYLKELEKRIGELKREGITPQEFARYIKDLKPDGVYIEEKHIPRLKALALVYEQYELLKEGRNKDVFDARGRYDFDDMIILADQALNKEPAIKKQNEDTYKFIMVDEFQDTNGAQLKFLFSLLGEKSPNVCCVGDDDQSIYRFQGATIGNFRELKKRFSDLKTISLKSNYRSSMEIIELSKNVIEDIPQEERTDRKALININDFKDKSIEYYEFTTQEEELMFLADKVNQLKEKIVSSKSLSKEERENPYNSIAILVRKREFILRIIDKFLQSGIPYATDGKEDISSETRVRQMMDLLDLAKLSPEDIQDKDRALYQVLVSDYLKIPHKDILEFIGVVNKKKKTDKNITLVSEFLGGEGLNSPELCNAQAIISKFLKNALFQPLHTVLMEYIKEAQLYKFILTKYDKESVIKIRELRALVSFINMIKNSDLSRPGVSLKDFKDEMETRIEHNMPIQGQLVTMTQNGVRILTAHSAKGQEFYSVLLPFCLQDKSWPAKPPPVTIPLPQGIIKTREAAGDKARISQLRHYDETRLFYVAVSRAKSNVVFTASPQENNIPSSFLHRLGIKHENLKQEEEALLIKSIEKADFFDPFIGTEEVLKDLVQDLRLNPTSINNYLNCRRKFLYDNVLMLPGAKKQNLIFGTAVHSALEHIFKVFMAGNKFPDFQDFKANFVDALKYQGIEKNMELRCMEQFEGLKPYFEKISRNPVRPIGLENKMPITVEGIIFTGKYDKLEIEDEVKGLVRVVDYKTGQPNKHAKGIFECRDLRDEECDGYLRQLVCYKLLYERDISKKDKGLTVSHGILAFVEPAKIDFKKHNIKKGEPTEFKVQLDDSMVKEMADIIKDVWQNIQALRFEKLPEEDDKKCRYCDFNSICWG